MLQAAASSFLRGHPPEGSAGSPLGHTQSPHSWEAGPFWNPCKRANLPGLDFPLNAPLFFRSEPKAVGGPALLSAARCALSLRAFLPAPCGGYCDLHSIQKEAKDPRGQGTWPRPHSREERG